MPELLPWKTVNTNTVHRNRWVELQLLDVETSAGALKEFTVVRTPPAVIVVSYTNALDVLFVRQWRHQYSAFTKELPAGAIEPGERTEAAARRELAEETGARADALIQLGVFNNSSGATDGLSHIFLAPGVTFGPTTSDAGNQTLALELVDMRTTLKLAEAGRIDDVVTLAALLLAAPRLRNALATAHP